MKKQSDSLKMKSPIVRDDNGEDLSTSVMNTPKRKCQPLAKPKIQYMQTSGRGNNTRPLINPMEVKRSLPQPSITTQISSEKNPNSHFSTAKNTLSPVKATFSCFSPMDSNPILSQSSCNFCYRKTPYSIIYEQLYKKYEETTQNTYNTNLVNDILMNSNTQLVEAFKESLIYDDQNEFVHELYNSEENTKRIEKLTDYYHKSSKVFPNFVILDEKKFMFKNIKRKQKAIDIKFRELKTQKKPLGKSRLFSKKFIDEISKRSFIVSNKNFSELIGDFISKDSHAQLEKTNCKNISATFCKKLITEKKQPITMELQMMLDEVRTKSSRQRRNIASTKRGSKLSSKPSCIDLAKTRSRIGNYRTFGKTPKRYMSQEEFKRETKKNPQSRIIDKEDNYGLNNTNMKSISINKEIVFPLKGSNNIDQIHINLNLIFDKDKVYINDPQTCVNREDNVELCLGIKPSIIDQYSTFERCTKIPEETRYSSRSRKPSTIRHRNTQNNTEKINCKEGYEKILITKKPNGGRSSVNPNDSKKMSHHGPHKTVINLLRPMKILGLIDDNKNKSIKNRLSPQRKLNYINTPVTSVETNQCKSSRIVIKVKKHKGK